MLSTPDIENLGKNVAGQKPAITLEKLQEICNGKEVLEICLRCFIEDSLRYTETICQFRQLAQIADKTKDEATYFVEVDAIRRGVHDSLVNSLCVLSRQLGIFKKDNSWIEKVPDRSSKGRLALITAFAFITRNPKQQTIIPHG